MNIKEFRNLNAVGASVRSGSALIAITLDNEWNLGDQSRGALSINEDGEEIGRWLILIDAEGEIQQRSDDFYRVTELFDVIRREEILQSNESDFSHKQE